MTHSLTNCWTKLFVALGVLCVHSVVFASSPPLPLTNVSRELQAGSSLESLIGPGQVDVFTVALQKDQFLHVTLKKKGVDVTLSLIDPTAKVLVKVDIPRTFGLESLSWIPENSGQYRIEVRKSERSHETGVYELSATALRTATMNDKSRIAAETALNAALNNEFGKGSNDRNATIQSFSMAAKLWRELGEGPTYEEAMCLNRIGGDWLSLNDQQNALQFLNQALVMRKAIGDLPGTAETLHNLGGVYADSSANGKALDVLNQALSIERELGYRQAEVATLNSIGTVYGAMGDNQRAMDFFNQALPATREMGDLVQESRVLNNIGNVHRALGESDVALEYYQLATQVGRNSKDQTVQSGQILDNRGVALAGLDENQKALECFTQALSIYQGSGAKGQVAGALNNIGLIHYRLGEWKEALDQYLKALPIFVAAGDRAGEAGTLLNIGLVYSRLGDQQNALKFVSQALSLKKEIGDQTGEAGVLNSLGRIQFELGMNEEALKSYQSAGSLAQKTGNRLAEASSQKQIGDLFARQGNSNKALDAYNRALLIFRSTGNRTGEAATLDSLRVFFENHGSPNTAIWFGRQAVSVLQSIRRDNRGLSEESKASYQASIASAYRGLASILIKQGRFDEAEEVLNFLKIKETSDFVTRDAIADKLKTLPLSDAEQKALARYEQLLKSIGSLGEEQSALLSKAAIQPLQGADLARSNQLDQDLSDANIVLQKFLDTLDPSLSPQPSAIGNLKDATSIQGTLRQAGTTVVAIYTLVLPDKYIAMLVTGASRQAYITAIKQSDLNTKVFDFRSKLANPASDPLPLAQELYQIVFPEQLRADLEKIDPSLIVWSLDSTLRYIPMAALHDGKEYLVKRFSQSLITPAYLQNLKDEPNNSWRGLGFGVSEARPNFDPLPSVREELNGIFRVEANGNQPIPGTIRLNGDFTWQKFRDDLKQPNKNIVHIATHFRAEPGPAASSTLLFGDAEVSLSEIAGFEQLFSDVDLLTLSACSTAFTNHSEDGREVDSLGSIAQRIGARSVIASLWAVNDPATARLMETMYRIRQDNPKLGKGEALRQAQEKMESGAMKPNAASSTSVSVDRAQIVGVNSTPETERDWTHPFFWAPFILIGNWK